MKKITKRIMALMLSLVMILGCVPSFINEASASANETDWYDLSIAMSGDSAATIGGVFEVNEDGNVRTIKLLKDITATETDYALEVSFTGPQIVLDLNGHILNRGLVDADGNEKYDDHGSVIEIIGGELTIKDSDPNKEHNGYINSNGLWHLDATGTPKTIKGGIITGGTGLTKNPGEEKHYGGGVYVSFYTDSESETHPGKLILERGTIAGNIAYGGGVKTENKDSEFIMNGGAISYNRSNNSAAGALCETGSIFTMNGGEISFNTSTGTGVGCAGGIYTSVKTNINGGKIINNKSEGYAGGVFVSYKDFTISGDVIIKDNINTQKTDGISWPQNLTAPSNFIKVVDLNSGEIYISFFNNTKGQGTGVLTSGCNGKGLNEVFFYDGPDTFYMDYDTNGELKIAEVPEDMKINIVSDHGTVSTNLSHSYAYIGDEVTLTVTPDSYYELDTLEVKDSNDNPIELVNNTFTKGDNAVTITATYKELPRPTGTKKYKADDKDTAEKVSGSGKKGSTRTITPIEGKKVASVIVTDKDGNKVDVALNEDGTYSFIQPASNVDVQVNYKNREITLNIGSTEASVDGETSNLDVAPILRNDRTMLPIRFVAENLGAKVEWNELEPNMVYITRGDIKIEIKLGSNIAKVNGKEYELDSVAFAENDRTYLPVRFVSEALNAIVEWNESKPNEVKIYEQ